jgi:hypothetical protein
MYHKALSHTPFALQRHLTNSGFTNIEIKAMGGWDAALAQMLGLWGRRRLRGGRRKRQLLRETLSRFFLPLIKISYERDRAPKDFKEGTMMTGLMGTARK